MARYVISGDRYGGDLWLSPVGDGPLVGSRLVVELSEAEFEDFRRAYDSSEAWHQRLCAALDDPANVEYGLTPWEASNLAFEGLPRKSRP